MAWEWSHTQQAYDDVRTQLERMPREWLIVVFAEWEAKTDRRYASSEFSHRKYNRALGKAKGRRRKGRPTGLADDILVDYIWDKMEEQRLCTNGGHEAWACPFGCNPHLIPFTDPEAEAEEQREAAETEAFMNEEWEEEE